MSVTTFQLLKDDSSFLVYTPNRCSLLDLDEKTYECLEQLQNGSSPEEISSTLGIPLEEINRILDCLGNANVCSYSSRNPREISRITIHVSNACNLRCKYCYASGGDYKMEQGFMSEKTAEEVINFILKNFDTVGHIVFFGGEPFLNLPVIKYICKRLNQLYQDGVISYQPSFGAVTNGYFAKEEIFSVIEENFTFLTVSIDGLMVIQ